MPDSPASLVPEGTPPRCEHVALGFQCLLYAGHDEDHWIDSGGDRAAPAVRPEGPEAPKPFEACEMDRVDDAGNFHAGKVAAPLSRDTRRCPTHGLPLPPDGRCGFCIPLAPEDARDTEGAPSETPNKDKIRAVVEGVLANKYDGPGGAQRLWMVAGILHGLADLLPLPEKRQIKSLAASLAESGDAELEEEWPK